MASNKGVPSPPLSVTISPTAAEWDVTVADWLVANKADALVVSSAVFQPSSLRPGAQPRMLLIKRASHDVWPSRWETPGGLADVSPATTRVIDEAARELWEESGLRARAVLAPVAGYGWMDGERVWRKATFLFEVETTKTLEGVGKDGHEEEEEEGVQVVLDPDEHQAYVWATEEEATQDRCGDVEISWTFPAQKANALEAFEVLRTLQGMKNGEVA